MIWYRSKKPPQCKILPLVLLLIKTTPCNNLSNDSKLSPLIQCCLYFNWISNFILLKYFSSSCLLATDVWQEWRKQLFLKFNVALIEFRRFTSKQWRVANCIIYLFILLFQIIDELFQNSIQILCIFLKRNLKW